MPFHIFSDALDGFGVTASGTFLDGEIDYNGVTQQIPGLSKESYQLTVYFERGGFEFRVSGRKRDSFLTEERGVSLSLVPIVDQGAELWDAQIGYDFSESGIKGLEGLRVSLQGQNLTDERFASVGASRSQVIDYQIYGRRFLAGFTFKF